MNLSTLKDLYHHMEWADAKVWRAVLDSHAGGKDEKLREYFYHLHLVQNVWLRAWRGEASDKPFPQFDNLSALMAWARSYYGDIFAYLDSLTDPDISATMQLPWAEIVEREVGRVPESITVAETMLQIPLHSLYHRGQINARLRAVGGEPPRVDYVTWIWLGRPKAEWMD